MDVPHRLDTKTSAGTGLPARGQKICVEGVKVLGREALQRHCANPRYDVVDDVATVGLEGAGAELGLLGRQPPLQEVLAERDPVGSAVVAVVALLDQVRK